MLDNIIIENEKGQLEINFDSLSMHTSEVFVSFIENKVPTNAIVSFDIDITDYKTRVILLIDTGMSTWLYTFNYIHYNDTFNFDFISSSVLERLGLKHV